MRKFEKWKKNKQLMANTTKDPLVIEAIYTPKYKQIDNDAL